MADIQHAVEPAACRAARHLPAAEKQAFADGVARRNVARAVEEMRRQSETLDRLAGAGRIAIVGAMYDVTTGAIEFLADGGSSPASRATAIRGA